MDERKEGEKQALYLNPPSPYLVSCFFFFHLLFRLESDFNIRI